MLSPTYHFLSILLKGHLMNKNRGSWSLGDHPGEFRSKNEALPERLQLQVKKKLFY